MCSDRKKRSAAARGEDSDDDRRRVKVGGIAFFSALFFALLFALVGPLALVPLWRPPAGEQSIFFAVSAVLGYLFAHVLVRRHFFVLCHEFKHALVSSLSGNKAKGMRIDRSSGHFEYEYTKLTAGSNAFISLAPYWLPIFTIPAAILSFIFWREHPQIIAAITGLAYGADCSFNWRDISPYQTDLTNIRGGFFVGLLFVLAVNVVVVCLLIPFIWHGPSGLKSYYFTLVQFGQLAIPHLIRR